jgi:hypothetical protein
MQQEAEMPLDFVGQPFLLWRRLIGLIISSLTLIVVAPATQGIIVAPATQG